MVLDQATSPIGPRHCAVMAGGGDASDASVVPSLAVLPGGGSSPLSAEPMVTTVTFEEGSLCTTTATASSPAVCAFDGDKTSHAHSCDALPNGGSSPCPAGIGSSLKGPTVLVVADEDCSEGQSVFPNSSVQPLAPMFQVLAVPGCEHFVPMADIVEVHKNFVGKAPVKAARSDGVSTRSGLWRSTSANSNINISK